MEKIKINDSKHRLYAAFKDLYAISFPIFEQRTVKQQEQAFASAGYHLIAYVENNNLIGFISYWEFPSYIYIEHFAINQSLRGQGYGSLCLKQFIAETTKTVLLEIDPLVDDIAKARLRFYQRCDFYSNSYLHIHPPYREKYQGHHLIVLSSGRMITGDEYQRFSSDLKEVVMSWKE